jgi:hypothetical protein
MTGDRRPSRTKTKSPSPLKILLIMGVAALVLGVIAITAVVLWFRSNADELRAGGTAAMEEGQKFGAGKTADACIKEALTRGDTCGSTGFMCEVKQKLFLQQCLGSSEIPAGFCDGVPPKSEILSSTSWLLKKCAGYGRGDDQRCGRLLQAVTEHCDGRAAR